MAKKSGCSTSVPLVGNLGPPAVQSEVVEGEVLERRVTWIQDLFDDRAMKAIVLLQEKARSPVQPQLAR